MKRKSTLRHHLIVAIISTAVLIYGIIRLIGRSLDDLGSLSFSTLPSRWGTNYLVTDYFFPLFGLAFCAFFSWWGFIEDWRLEKQSNRGVSLKDEAPEPEASPHKRKPRKKITKS